MRTSIIGSFLGMLAAIAMFVACGSGGGGSAAGSAITTEEFADLQAAVEELRAQLPLVQAPTGTLAPFAGAEAPDGWLPCDGAEVSRTEYAALFAAIGTAWGEGDGSTTFHLPDLRGRFLRGVDDGVGRDPEAGSRFASAPGGNAGDAVGSIQAWATGLPQGAAFETDSAGEHDHGYRGQAGGSYHGTSPGIPAAPSGTLRTTADGAHTHTVTAGGDAETRPANAAVQWLIRA